MNTLYEAAKQALAFTMRDFASLRDFEAAKAVLQDTMRSALVEEEKAAVWLAERKEHWRKEREKMQVTKDQDPELSAALGWPGGTSDPVLDRTRLLQMVAALRVASKQTLDWLYENDILHPTKVSEALRAVLAQQAEPVAVAERERIAAQWDGCVTHQLDTFGPVDIGASIRAGELVEPAQQVEPLINQCGETCERAKLCAVCASKLAEPVEPVAWAGYDLEGMVEAFSRVIEAHHSSKHPFHNPIDMDAKMALRILRGFIPAMKAYAAPPQRKPLTEEEIDECFESVMFNPDIEPTRELIARAIEAAHGIKEGT